MSVSYDLFTAAFLGKVTEYDFIPLEQYNRNSIVDGYMVRACAQFNKICKYDLLSRDDAVREFMTDIPDDFIIGQIKYFVKRDRQLDGSQIRR